MKDNRIPGKKLSRQDMQRINGGGQQHAAAVCFQYVSNCRPCTSVGCRCTYQSPGLYLCQ
ncbi:hypothetical protein KTO58_12105 [Chitinophaga pendula]|uniref:hypothetical protein n=1 Tax=Chitinophaga TaxID=79328 RepID=UPI0012FDC7EA|nr:MULTISPECIES: hypothetical protein [Chitinophaga]UCJ09903.1 hypothetical protein KTO58_12105 [Chitinophaga pendula]